MKIICDSCGTKYSISDDKVRGKVFKIRCKKCSHIIVVRGGESGADEAAPAPAAEGGGGWHIVVEGEQVGPIPDADVRGRIERGEIKGDTYIWKEGFADWLKISTVPEFSDMVTVESAPIAVGDVFASDSAAPQPTNGSDRSGGRRRSGASRPLFGNGTEGDVFAAPVAAAAPAGGDLFGSATHSPASSESRWPSAGSGGGGGSGMSASHHDGGRVDNLTGQRHENSVLFSLSNLQSLAMPSPKPVASMGGGGPVPTTEGSGLIDIRAMAANSGAARPADGRIGGSPAEDDLPAFGSFSPAAPVLLPLPSGSGPPKWIYAVIVAMIGLVGVVGYLAFKVIMPKPAPVVVVQAPPAPAPAEPAKTVVAAKETGDKAPAIPDDKLPPREGGEGVSAKEGGDKAKEKSSSSSRSKSKREGKKSGASEDSGNSGNSGKKGASSPTTGPLPAEPPKPAKGSLEDLINGATKTQTGGGGGRPKVSDGDKGGGESAGPLARGAVVSGMNALKPKVQECYNQFKVPGMATFNFVIGKNGKVSSSTVTGKFAGTPTGACVEKAIKTATFPPSDGLSASYAFPLK